MKGMNDPAHGSDIFLPVGCERETPASTKKADDGGGEGSQAEKAAIAGRISQQPVSPALDALRAPPSVSCLTSTWKRLRSNMHRGQVDLETGAMPGAKATNFMELLPTVTVSFSKQNDGSCHGAILAKGR
jgi:hypothetical protein